MTGLCFCPSAFEVDAESPVVEKCPTGVCRGGSLVLLGCRGRKGRKSRETRAGPGCEGPGNVG